VTACYLRCRLQRSLDTRGGDLVAVNVAGDGESGLYIAVDTDRLLQ